MEENKKDEALFPNSTEEKKLQSGDGNAWNKTFK